MNTSCTLSDQLKAFPDKAKGELFMNVLTWCLSKSLLKQVYTYLYLVAPLPPAPAASVVITIYSRLVVVKIDFLHFAVIDVPPPFFSL
jgi:hypothetical protein